jgi:hypothetical protein
MASGQPVAYFRLNALGRGVPLNRVHNMIADVRRTMGHERSGLIEISEPAQNGDYLIIFYERDAADVFERLYRQTGQQPLRSTKPPADIAIVEFEVSVVVLMERDPNEFRRRLRGEG